MKEFEPVSESTYVDNASGSLYLDSQDLGRAYRGAWDSQNGSQNTRVGIADSDSSLGLGRGLGRLGFPDVDLTGFEQEAEYKPTDGWDAFCHSVKHLFYKDETVGEKVKRKVEEGMSPAEREKYKSENEVLERYQREVRDWSLLSTIDMTRKPKQPDTPMHDEIKRRTEQARRAIEEGVKDGMSYQERGELNKEIQAYRRAERQFDPLGTGGGQKPELGPAMRAYFKKIAEAADRYVDGG
ncbi:MAG: hypothetical protein K2Y32_11035 [Candidatus Obscuribacterales bacterium]|nr:hypothetical protein [Candidatus Obscuribacterales bacterium]